METQYSLFGRKIAYKWIVLSVTTIGALMAAIDSTIVILGLPDMMVKLHADLVSMIWVIMAYILVSTVFLLTFGRVADMSRTRAHVQFGLRGFYHRLRVMRLFRQCHPIDHFPFDTRQRRGDDGGQQRGADHRSLPAQ